MAERLHRLGWRRALARSIGGLLAALALAMSAAAPAGAFAEPTQAQATLPRIPLAITTSGGVHRYKVEVAATPEQQASGLMFRTRMKTSEGMIFPFVPPRPASFWMENTILPLDLVFVGADHRVLNVAANAVPYSRAFILSNGPAAAVVELNAGEAARIGLRPGDRVDYTAP